MMDNNKHYVAVIGGSIAGSEAAHQLSSKGFRVVVFDMKALPYGKIEDGLPNWHINLRNRQQREIDRKLDHENVRFVPMVKIGTDLDFMDLVENWGFTAVILANGAWCDRPLPVAGIDKFKDRGLIYQNDLIYWFNHKHEADYHGKRYELEDGAVIVGGGLASLDVVKIYMIELVRHKLKALFGIEVDVFTLEKWGVDKVLRQQGIEFEELGLKGVTLVYRRTAQDMPLKSSKDDTQASMDRARVVSERLLENYKGQFKFHFRPLSIPDGFQEQAGKLTGLVLQKVSQYKGRVIPIKGETELLETTQIVSSIGSVPEQIKGLPYEESSLKMRLGADYHVAGFDHVFAVGNAVTGKGNIQESKQHGSRITQQIIDLHLTQDALEDWLVQLNETIKSNVERQMASIIKEIIDRDIQPDDIIKSILQKTKSLNDAHGYKDYKSWVANHLPVRLETILGLK